MFKKLTAAALAVVLTLGAAALPMADSGIDLTSITASAETYGDYEYSVLDNGTVEITKYNGNESNVTIPSSINGKKVTSIGEYAFFECTSLTSITIPDGVTSIGNYAFYESENLTSIKMPDSVLSIGGMAFEYTPWLTAKRNENPLVIVNNIIVDGSTCEGEVTIPDTVTSISDYAFELGKRITGVTIPKSIKNISTGAFNFCTKLTSVTIPDNVTSIGDYAFENCSSLKSITISDGVKSIGKQTFENCENLTSIKIPDSVTSIGDSAFEGCSSLTSVTISKNITSLENSTFYGCSNLTDVKIPDGVTSIKNSVFSNCTNLKSITIPDSVKSIGEGVFVNCYSLTSITIPKNVTSIGDGAIGYNHEMYAANYVLVPNFKIYCYLNSVGEKYAKENGFDYELLDHTTHTWDSGKVTKAATYSSTGTMTYTCTVCGATKTSSIARKALPKPAVKTNYTNTCSEIRINWNKVSGVTGYKIFRYDDAKKKWVDVKAIYDPNATNYKITSLAPNTSYKFMVKSFVKVGSKVYFSDASKTITAKTKAIAKLTGKTNFTYTTNAVRINWNKISGVTGYKVYRYDDAKKKWVDIKTIYDPSATNYKVSGLSAGKVYKFRVKAFVKSGSKVYYGDSCNTISTATRPNTTKITKSNKASTAVRLYWNKTTCSGYRIEKYDSAKKKWVRVTAVGSPSTTQYRISGLKKNTTYKFRIQPYVKVGSKVIYGTASAAYTVKTTK